MNCSSILILFRAPDTLALYGIPYDMRAGQQPGDLWRSTLGGPGPRADWIYLGSPGWYGTMSNTDMEQVKAFLAGRDVPGNPYEWDRISPEVNG